MAVMGNVNLTMLRDACRIGPWSLTTAFTTAGVTAWRPWIFVSINPRLALNLTTSPGG